MDTQLPFAAVVTSTQLSQIQPQQPLYSRKTYRIRRQNIWTTIIAIVILFGVSDQIQPAVSECPRQCECKWKSGKESVLCLNANLSGVPIELDPGTQVLDLTGNEIANIPSDAFSRANLLNLQKVFIAKCRLKLIDRYAFRKLINLVELDMSYNILTMIPSHTFESIPELRELKLIGNPIQRILNDAFQHVPQLVRLELSDCRIGTIESKAFSGLEQSLEWLKIDGNKLIEIKSTTLTSLQNLHGLELAGNPWNCSCQLRPLREWMLHDNIPYGIPPVCRFPLRLATKSWDKIDLDDFACVPHILAPDIRAHGVEGRNVTMSCMVGGVPEPNVRWMIRNRVIANLTGNTMFPAAQGRKMYMVNLQQNESNLTILTAEVQDAGVYTCAAENKAGKVEASVTLAVSRKPHENTLSAKVMIASVIVAALFVVASSLAVVCVCTLRKRRKIGRWNMQRRTESYEKIEMNHKPTARSGYKSPRCDGSAFMKPYGENGISVVGQNRKNGDYRNVPSEDDGTGYEDNIESTNTTLSNTRRETASNKWKSSSTVKSPTSIDTWHTTKQNSRKNSPRGEETDLHIPRLIEFSDATPDSGPSTLSGHYDSLKTSNGAMSSITNYTKPNWPHQRIRKVVNNNSSNLFGVENENVETISVNSITTATAGCSTGGLTSSVTQKQLIDIKTSESDCDSGERKYPDLLDISSLSNTNSSNNYKNASNSSSAFCTLPRKKHNNVSVGRYLKTVSDSQSPLLPSDCPSRYSSSNFSGNSDMDIINRRLSIDSYTGYPLSSYGTTKSACGGGGGRSNSFLNLVSSPNVGGKLHKRNPSLPSSPIKEPTAKISTNNALSPAATPLLDFSTLQSRNAVITATPSPSTSTTTASAYDYHAAQLERFLEEYRNLQEQLCKMKETCDSIRKKEAPHRSSGIGQSVKSADPVMYTAAALATNSPVLSDDVTGNPKGILKTHHKSLIPGQPNPPPYWLHRNAILKRLQDPQTDFFQS